MPKELLYEIIDDVRNKTITHKSKFTKNFFQQLDEMQKQNRSTKNIYNEEDYISGQKKGKAQIEYLDKIRGTDIKTILSKNKKVLEWWKNI